jgi:hypothetical protein
VATKKLLLIVVLLVPGPLFAQSASAPVKPGAPAASDVDSAVIEVLRKSTAAQLARKSFRALMDNSIGGYVLPSLQVEVVYPDRIRVKRSGLEVVSVGGKTMMKQGDKWSPAPEGVSNFIGSFGDSKNDEKMYAQAVFAKSLGQTKIDERIVNIYELHSKTKTGLIKSKIFISPDDGLVRRTETRGEIKGKEAIFNAMLGDYGVPIAIELPK